MHGVDPAQAPNEADRLRGLHAANWLVDSRLDDAVALVRRSDAEVRDPTHPPTRCEIDQKTSFDYISNHRSQHRRCLSGARFIKAPIFQG
jgi:hypothetical protein